MINADLHCHSIVSDGTLAPAEVAKIAAEASVELWALTDHDELGGQSEARAAAEAFGMRYVSGVEISITWAGRTVHMLGLGINADDPLLIQNLAAMRDGRSLRAKQMGLQLLNAVGISDAYAGALKYVGKHGLISRTHFARYLVEIGQCKSISDVFSRYLTEGKPGYVAHCWATLEDAVKWIHDAQGIAVVAHPGRYKFSSLEFSGLFDSFRDLGGEAIEVVTGSHTPEQYREYADIARRYNFLASRGSDFHGPTQGRAQLGKLPPLPEGLIPVWSRWY
ncbi:PHP domain-containing protein [Candidatus Pandoraea novymonadis]|uniref:3',5'-nucleoside bisphosphate phosphatase n=1 Tax=Candidatus Pandoraea novymonadis TaxID=1808959 RepID=A0ABX5FES6_9BURK|nr:PHP domain-containing protein [Candidatus Pandoraea novymonadis]PSB92213.1 3',5'-nucleoside bisphosphate phosphatase [Candidatus Pandoraea novymonadis]